MIDQRGFFGIGIQNIKTESNIGTLWRSANILGADFIYTIGKRYKKQSSDTMKTFKHIPLYHYETFEDFYNHLPFDCRLVGIELDDKSRKLEKYVHPERCVYLLGAEDHGLTKEALAKCHDIIQIAGDHCLNVSVAGSIVMYDRYSKVLTKTA